MIEKFEIIGLFGDRSININFQKDENVKILIGENGTGKTHILNILYYILSGKIEKLADIEFEKVILKIKNIEQIEISKQDIIAFYREDLGRDYNWYKYKRREINLFDFDEDIKYFEKVKEKIKKIKIEISKIVNSNTLIYLPTYRRVEEDLEKLGLSDIIDKFETKDNKFIQFGMDDTNQYIQKLLNDIKKLSLEGFNEMSGDIINTLIDNNNNIDKTYSKTIKNIEILNIILDRSKKVSTKNKKIIIEKVENEEIFKEDTENSVKLLISP